jgi:hypothetical protein
MKKIIISFLIGVLFNSCSVSSDVVSNKKIQKRKYTSGLSIRKPQEALYFQKRITQNTSELKHLHFKNHFSNSVDSDNDSEVENLTSKFNPNFI